MGRKKHVDISSCLWVIEVWKVASCGTSKSQFWRREFFLTLCEIVEKNSRRTSRRFRSNDLEEDPLAYQIAFRLLFFGTPQTWLNIYQWTLKLAPQSYFGPEFSFEFWNWGPKICAALQCICWALLNPFTLRHGSSLSHTKGFARAYRMNKFLGVIGVWS